MNITITDAELEIMRLLWQENRALTIAALRAVLEQSKGWNKSTIHTLVSRLREKGAITHLDKYGAAQYVPLITEDEYMLAEADAVYEKFGDVKKLAIAMVRGGHLSDSDIDELRDFFKMGDN